VTQQTSVSTLSQTILYPLRMWLSEESALQNVKMNPEITNRMFTKSNTLWITSEYFISLSTFPLATVPNGKLMQRWLFWNKKYEVFIGSRLVKIQEFILGEAWKSLSLFRTHIVYVTRQLPLREPLLICLESGFLNVCRRQLSMINLVQCCWSLKVLRLIFSH